GRDKRKRNIRSAVARAEYRDRRRESGKSCQDSGDGEWNGYRRRWRGAHQFPADVPEPASGIAVGEWHRVYSLGFARRRWSLSRLGDGIQREYFAAGGSAECHSKRVARRHLARRRGTLRRWRRRYLSLDRKWHRRFQSRLWKQLFEIEFQFGCG